MPLTSELPKKITSLFLFFFAATTVLFSVDEDVYDFTEPAPRDAGEKIIHGVIAGAETLLSNGVVMFTNIFVYNKFINKVEWATPTSDSVYSNFNSSWAWEKDDGFKVNQIGHPYQGSVYFNTGRVNGFNFFESVIFSAVGSYTWETLGENHQKSLNDFITTVGASVSLGEILFRLYLEADGAGIPFPFTALINPMAAFHRLTTDWEPPETRGNIYRLKAYLGTGYALTDSSIINSSGRDAVFSFRGPAAHAGISLVYGNPFEQDVRIPFNHFEFDLSLGLNPGNYFGFRFISDAYLFSITPVHSNKDKMSTGLSLYLDSVSEGKPGSDSTVDLFSNALGWTTKYQHLFSNNFNLQFKLHSGLTFMGVSEFHTVWNDNQGNKNYGSGFSAKCFINLEHDNLGNLELGALYYILWPYPETSALTEGNVYWLFADAAYYYRFSKHLSLGVKDSFALERGSYEGFPDTRKYNNEIKLFLAWNL